jgi:hypothetical protein
MWSARFLVLMLGGCAQREPGGGASAEDPVADDSSAPIESPATDEDHDDDGYDEDVDCDDDDAAVHPAATETCNGVDDDCDDEVDEDASDATLWYVDADGDGFGAESVLRCVNDEGFVEAGGDCDDADVRVYPGAGEVCDDGVDNDCISGGIETCRQTGVIADEDAYQVITNPYSDSTSFWPDVSGAGDVNGDGLPDILVGLPDYHYTANDRSDLGAAFLCYGPLTEMESLAECIGVFDPDAPQHYQLGQSVTGLGDVNGDGYDDFFVGSPYPRVTGDPTASEETVAYVFFGPIDDDVGPDDADVMFVQYTFDAQLGTDAAPGPVRAGEHTVIVSAPRYPHGYSSGAGFSYGSIYVVGLDEGGEINETVGYGYVGVMRSDVDLGNLTFGDTVRDLRDTDGDGIEDFATGSNNVTPYFPGITYVVTDSPVDEVQLDDSDAILEAAFKFGPARDENGDGYTDILVSSADNRVRLFLGPLADTFDVRTAGTEEASFVIPPEEFIRAYDPVGVDLDGDPFADIAFTTTHEMGDGTDAGLFVQYAPAAGAIALNDMSLIVTGYVDPLTVLENVGDLDVDGHEDLVVATAAFDGFDLHLLFGSGL